MKNKFLLILNFLTLSACAHYHHFNHSPRGTNNLGVIIEREKGSIQIVDTTKQSLLKRVDGLGDLSHASLVFSQDGQFAFVFGRDGGLTKVDLLKGKIIKRIIQAGNSIGGAISQDGQWVAVSNYTPGGIKIFNAESLELLTEISALGSDGKNSKVVGLVDAPNNQFVFSLFESGEIWIADVGDPKNIQIQKFPKAGKEPYDALVTPEGRYYIAGLFGEDGLSMIDLWHPEKGIQRILPEFGKAKGSLPVFKMPHFEGWSVSGQSAFVPGVGKHELIVVDRNTWKEKGRVTLAGQPIFAMLSPTGRQIWVNFALPHNHIVQVIDVETLKVVHQYEPGKGILHFEFTPKGDKVWLSVRDENRVEVYSTRDFKKLGELAADRPSGIFFTNRAGRIGL